MASPRLSSPKLSRGIQFFDFALLETKPCFHFRKFRFDCPFDVLEPPGKLSKQLICKGSQGYKALEYHDAKSIIGIKALPPNLFNICSFNSDKLNVGLLRQDDVDFD